MTIDEAIAYEKIDSEPCSILCTHTTNRNDCIECRAYHKQLAEWLEELKAYKENQHRSLRHMYEKGYNKAIDDFVNFANTMPTVEADGEIRPMRLEEMAEQLKEGGLNE